jgi:hypothetical protein
MLARISFRCRPRDPAFARFASFGGFKSDEAWSAKAEGGDPVRRIARGGYWMPCIRGA